MDPVLSGRVTHLLDAIGEGDRKSSEELLELLYTELRSLARSRMSKLPPGDTLQPTALIHETYLRLMGSGPGQWNSSGHFWGAASKAMWRVLIDRAREKGSLKRGGKLRRVDPANLEFSLDSLVDESRADDVLALDRALERLGKDSRRGRIVLLRFVAGLSVEEVAEALETSVRTVEREWHFARLFLYRELSGHVG